jgi:hypothetical protein
VAARTRLHPGPVQRLGHADRITAREVEGHQRGAPGRVAGSVDRDPGDGAEPVDAYGVHYLRYWVDQEHGKVFCLVDAPDADAAATVHREAHGLVADEIYPVAEGA